VQWKKEGWRRKRAQARIPEPDDAGAAQQEHGVSDTVHGLVESELARDLGPLDLPCSFAPGGVAPVALRCVCVAVMER
jgi:hypothetical protein